MTPVASRLQTRLEDRILWFRNQWLFKWHHIKGDRPVEIDTFDGRHARFSGIMFDGSARDVYWTAITRGIRQELDDQFHWIDENVRRYPRITAETSIDECAGMVSSFVDNLRRHVVQKDRILRGNGLQFPAENDVGDWRGLTRNEINERAIALKKALFPPLQITPIASTTETPHASPPTGHRTMPMTTRQRAELFARALFNKTGPNLHSHSNFRDVGKDLEWTDDQVKTAANYAVEIGLAQWKALGGYIGITVNGIDLAEQIDAARYDNIESASPLNAEQAKTSDSEIRIENVANSIIQVGGDGARQSAVASPDAIAVLNNFVDALRPVLSGINERSAEVDTLKAHVTSLQAQLATPAPRRSILLEIVKDIVETLASDAIKHVVLAAMPTAPAMLHQILRLLGG